MRACEGGGVPFGPHADHEVPAGHAAAHVSGDGKADAAEHPDLARIVRSRSQESRSDPLEEGLLVGHRAYAPAGAARCLLTSRLAAPKSEPPITVTAIQRVSWGMAPIAIQRANGERSGSPGGGLS